MENQQKHWKTTFKAGRKCITEKVWNNITSEYLRSLYKSMPKHVQVAVDAQHGHTQYKMHFNMFAAHL